MALTFITGNEGKLRAVQRVFPDVEQLDLDLEEIQSTDPQAVIEHKLRQAREVHTGAFMVEDTSLEMDSLNGLPGPLIKWFLQKLGTEGLARLAAMSSPRAVARTVIGFCDASGQFHFFSATLEGTVVAPRGTNGFGWDAVFQPLGAEKTFGEMTAEEKAQYSARHKALLQLKDSLQ